MRDQTCARVLDVYTDSIGTARTLVKGWSPLRWGLVLAVTIGTSILLVVSVSNHLGRSEPDAQEAQPILIARHYIPPFSVIKSDDVSVRNYPREWLPLAALHQETELHLKDGHPSFLSAVAIPAGQPLIRTVLLETNRNHGLAAVLPIGTVAVSFNVDKVRGVGGWIQPGDKVSIFSTIREMDPRMRTAASTHLIFPSVEVMAVSDQRLGNTDDATADAAASKDHTESSDDGSVITVRMNPIEAGALVQARENGHLSVTLRALGDDASLEPVDVLPQKG